MAKKYGKDYVQKNAVEREGKRVGTELIYDDGTRVVLLNSHGKTTKYFNEVTTGKLLTNDFSPKVNPKSNKQYTLRDMQRSFRAGYLQAQSDNAKAYKAKNGIKLIK